MSAQCGRPGAAHDPQRGKAFELANSVVIIEAGRIARVERVDGREYAGPLPPATIAALEEVANG